MYKISGLVMITFQITTHLHAARRAPLGSAYLDALPLVAPLVGQLEGALPEAAQATRLWGRAGGHSEWHTLFKLKRRP